MKPQGNTRPQEKVLLFNYFRMPKKQMQALLQNSFENWKQQDREKELPRMTSKTELTTAPPSCLGNREDHEQSWGLIFAFTYMRVFQEHPSGCRQPSCRSLLLLVLLEGRVMPLDALLQANFTAHFTFCGLWCLCCCTQQAGVSWKRELEPAPEFATNPPAVQLWYSIGNTLPHANAAWETGWKNYTIASALLQ